jgi:hypothetical protein
MLNSIGPCVCRAREITWASLDEMEIQGTHSSRSLCNEVEARKIDAMKTLLCCPEASLLVRFSVGVVALAALLPACTVSNTSAGGGDELDGVVPIRQSVPSERSAQLFGDPGDNLLATLDAVEAADADVLVLNNSVVGAVLNEAGAYYSASTLFQPGGAAYKAQSMQCRGRTLPDAVDTVCAILAEGEVQVVFVDETPHFAQHRVFGQKLLQCARDAGFQFLAVQALEEDGAALAARGHVSKTASGPYLREPQFARLVDEGLELGYTPLRITSDPICRDCSPIEAFAANLEPSADSLLAQTLDIDPAAKVLVWTGPGQAYEQPWGRALPFNVSLASIVFEKSGINPYTLVQLTMEPSSALGPLPPSGIYLASGPDNGSCSGSYSPGSATGRSTHDGVVVHVAPPVGAQGSDAERWSWLHTPAENRMTVTPECATCQADERLLVQAFPPGAMADRVPADQALCQPGVPCQFALAPGDYQLVVWNDTEQLATAPVTLAAGTPSTVTMN